MTITSPRLQQALSQHSQDFSLAPMTSQLSITDTPTPLHLWAGGCEGWGPGGQSLNV